MLRAGARASQGADAEVRTVTTMTAALLGLADWLAGLGVTRVGACLISCVRGVA